MQCKHQWPSLKAKAQCSDSEKNVLHIVVPCFLQNLHCCQKDRRPKPHSNLIRNWWEKGQWRQNWVEYVQRRNFNEGKMKKFDRKLPKKIRETWKLPRKSNRMKWVSISIKQIFNIQISHNLPFPWEENWVSCYICKQPACSKIHICFCCDRWATLQSFATLCNWLL